MNELLRKCFPFIETEKQQEINRQVAEVADCIIRL